MTYSVHTYEVWIGIRTNAAPGYTLVLSKDNGYPGEMIGQIDKSGVIDNLIGEEEMGSNRNCSVCLSPMKSTKLSTHLG